MLLQAAGTLTQPGMAEHPPALSPLYGLSALLSIPTGGCWIPSTKHPGGVFALVSWDWTAHLQLISWETTGLENTLSYNFTGKKKIKNSSLGLEGHPRKSDMSPQILMPTHTTSQAAAEPISVSTHHQHGARASARELTLEFSLVSYLQLQFSLTPSGKNCVQLLLKPNICMYAFLNKLSTCKYLA